MWNERIRLISFCAIAPSTPTTIVMAAIQSSSVPLDSGNSCTWVRRIAYTPTLVRRPANTAVTGLRALG